MLFPGGRLVFVAVPTFVRGKNQYKVDGGYHYPWIVSRSYYPDNLLVFLLPNSWVDPGKERGAELLYLLLYRAVTQPSFSFVIFLKPSGLIDSKPLLYLDLFPLEVLVSLTAQVR